MDYLLAILSGILQGATEFIPVSSSAHLVILRAFAPAALDAAAMDAFLHLGSLAGLMLALQEDLGHICGQLLLIVRDALKNAGIFLKSMRDREEPRYARTLTSNYRRLALLILAASLPTAIVGLLLRRLALRFYGSTLYTGAGLMVTGVVILVVSRVQPSGRLPKEIPVKRGFLAGLVQGICVLPGLSRAGMTMSVAILLGFGRKMAVRYAYLIGIPAIAGAGILELVLAGTAGLITAELLGMYLAGMAAACLASFVFVKGLLSLSRSLPLAVFAVYNILLGVAAIALHLMPPA